MSNKYISAASANFIFFVINSIFFIVITPISLKVMGEAFFGLWSILYAMILLSNIGTLGISSIVNKFASEAHPEAHQEDYFNQVLTGGILIVLPMAALAAAALALGRTLIAAGLSGEAAQQEQLRSALVWIALGLLPQFLAKVPQGFLLSQLQNRTARLIETFSVTSLWLGAVVMAGWAGRDLSMIGAWSVLISLVTSGLYFRAASRLMHLHPQLNLGVMRRMLNFSGFMWIESTAIALFQHLDKLIVGLTLGPALAGVYAVGTSIGLRMSMVVGQLTEVLIPYASLRDSLKDYDRLRSVYRKVSKYVSLIVAGIGGLAIVWMDEFLSVWISPAYAAQNAAVFRWLILAYAFLSLCRPGHQTLTGMGKVRFTSLVYAGATFIMLISLYFLSEQFGLSGAILANFMMLFLLAYNLFVYRQFGYQKQIQVLLIDLLGGLLVPGLAISLISFSPTIIMKLVMTIIVCGLIVLTFIRDEWMQTWTARILNHAKSDEARLPY